MLAEVLPDEDERLQVLLVPGDGHPLAGRRLQLEFDGYGVLEAPSAEAAHALLGSIQVDLIFLCLPAALEDAVGVVQPFIDDLRLERIPLVLLAPAKLAAGAAGRLRLRAQDWLIEPRRVK